VLYYVDLAFNGLVFGCMYALMAVGLTLVYGLLRILHIAHAAVYAFGAYVAVIVANGSGSIGVGFAAALVTAAVLGMAIYRLLYQPLLAYPPYVAMIASIGLLVFMEDGFRIAFGEQGLTFAHNPYPTQLHEFAGLTVNTVQVAIVAAAVICLTLLALFTTRTRVGIAWRATVSDAPIATSFGVDAVKVRYLNFAIGSALAALAGALIGLLNNFVEPTMGFVVSYKALAIIVLGGLGSLQGTLIASLVLGLVESYGTIFVGKFLDRDAIAFLFLIAVLIVRPKGLGGVKTT
jgi:branched-chain amino acid transport system permease protein